MDFDITFLGTSAASVSPHVSTSACLVRAGDTVLMVDAGIGALRQLRRAGVDPDEIDAVLVTHWHWDHTGGLLALVKARQRSKPLPIYGPHLHLLSRIYLGVFCPSIFAAFVTVNAGSSIDFRDVRAETIATVHEIASVGWSLAEQPPGQRKIVISGDTRPAESIVSAARGADLLIHEATFLDRHAVWAVLSGHSRASDAAGIAVKAGVGALALTHLPSRYSIEDIRAEASVIFPGVLIPSPLETISIETVTVGADKQGCGWAKLRATTPPAAI
jgi:ribonuclease Z